MITSSMYLSDLLGCESLKYSRVVVPPESTDSQVTGINILEAPDIEKWGKKGLVILTSYFALQDLSQFELEEFFGKLNNIGINCLIVKINRLVKEIPANFIDLCQSNHISLLEIDITTKYEEIIAEVLGFILSRREQRLSLYYQLSKISSRMAIDMLGIHEILREFKQFLQLDLTLEDLSKGKSTSTNQLLARYEMLEEMPLDRWEFMTFSYKRFHCRYLSSGSTIDGSLISVTISAIEGRKYSLIIHERQNHSLTVNDVIVIENLTLSIQLELMRESYGKQRQLLNKNTLINDVLRRAFTVQEEFNVACSQLGLDPNENVRVMTIDYYHDQESDGITLYDLRANFRTEIQRIHPRSIYYIAPGYDQFIFPVTSSSAQMLAADSRRVIDNIFNLSEIYPNLRFYGGISASQTVNEIDQADSQSKNIASFLTRNYPHNIIEIYDNLGIFKLFINESTHDLSQFVKPEIISLYKERPELFNTISTFLKTGRSFTRTAEELFLHPKTVKYRVEKTNELLNLDLDNIQDAMILLASIEIINFHSGNRLKLDSGRLPPVS